MRARRAAGGARAQIGGASPCRAAAASARVTSLPALRASHDTMLHDTWPAIWQQQHHTQLEALCHELQQNTNLYIKGKRGGAALIQSSTL